MSDQNLSLHPGALALLLAIHTNGKLISKNGQRFLAVLLDHDLVGRSDPLAQYRCTPRGRAFVAMLGATPLPELSPAKWQDPRTGQPVDLATSMVAGAPTLVDDDDEQPKKKAAPSKDDVPAFRDDVGEMFKLIPVGSCATLPAVEVFHEAGVGLYGAACITKSGTQISQVRKRSLSSVLEWVSDTIGESEHRNWRLEG